MDFLSRMNDVVSYIEAHLDSDLSYSDLAGIVCCSVYQFGRIFSYVVGVPLAEYIRRRRLSQAALVLQNGGCKVIDVAIRYGYQSPDAFTRAFQTLHGVTPKDACSPGVKLRLYPPIAFHLSIKGAEQMEYRIEEKGIINCVGITKNFGKVVVNKDAGHWTETRPDIWQYWNYFLDEGENLIIRDKYKLYRTPFWQVGYDRIDETGDTVISIGAEARDGENYPELVPFQIPAHTWSVFTAKGTLDQAVHPVTQTMTRVMTDWLPNSSYDLIPGISLEVYGPGNTQEEDYVTELWLPVQHK